jgi:hypothetical protein
MKALLVTAIFGASALLANADSGGPYEFIPDLSQSDRPPVNQIPSAIHPLEFYLTHFPDLIWDKAIGEPTTFEWKDINGYYAVPVDCGYIPYTRVVAVRYVSKDRLNQGLLHADAILILGARSEDNSYQPIYFTLGGPSVYNHRVEVVDGDEQRIRVFRDLSGTGGFTEQIVISVANDRSFKTERK